jgi:sugar lactone lactonase YvrE
MKKTFLLATILIETFATVGCSEDNDPQLNLSDYTVIVSNIVDEGDECSPNDIEFKLSEPVATDQIIEYRVFFCRSDRGGTPSAESLYALPSSNFSSFKNTGSSLTLNADQLSTSDEKIEDGINYQLIVLTIGTFNNTDVLVASEPSESFSLNSSIDESQLQVLNVLVMDRFNVGSASDAVISFSLPLLNNADISYKLVVAPATETIDISAIDGLANASFQEIAPNNSSSLQSITLSADLKDIEGNDIIQNESYVAYILTSVSFKGEIVEALVKSNEFTLTINPETSTLVAGISANDAIALDANGNLYVAEYGVYNQSILQGDGTSVLKVTPEGDVTVLINSLNSPVGNTIDNDGSLLLSNNNNGSSGDVVRIDQNGTKSTIATIPGYPAGILVGNNSDYFVSNYWTLDIYNPRGIISRIDKDGKVSVFANDSRLEFGVGIDYDDKGNILIGNYETGEILSVNDSGVVSTIATLPVQPSAGTIGYIDFYDGYIYATGLNAGILYRVSLNGDIEEYAGSGISGTEDGELKNATFNRLNGIAIDEEKGIIYVTDMSLGADGRPNGKADIRIIPITN